jgi:hypothetical protein
MGFPSAFFVGFPSAFFVVFSSAYIGGSVGSMIFLGDGSIRACARGTPTIFHLFERPIPQIALSHDCGTRSYGVRSKKNMSE